MFPPSFSSQKEYDAYLSCLSNLKPGDKIEYTSTYGKVEGVFLHAEQSNIRPYGGSSTLTTYSLFIGTRELSNPLFYVPTASEKRAYISPAKKACPKILVGATNVCWVPTTARIEKIVKYNAVQEEKEKKEKAKAAKSIRARSKHA